MRIQRRRCGDGWHTHCRQLLCVRTAQHPLRHGCTRRNALPLRPHCGLLDTPSARQTWAVPRNYIASMPVDTAPQLEWKPWPQSSEQDLKRAGIGMTRTKAPCVHAPTRTTDSGSLELSHRRKRVSCLFADPCPCDDWPLISCSTTTRVTQTGPRIVHFRT